MSGCHQGLHADAPHGPFAFVLSLTNWEGRRFSGGETMLLQPHVLDYWRRFDSGVGTELPQLTTLIPPRLGQLTVFDGRIPHGVQPVSLATAGSWWLTEAANSSWKWLASST